MNDKKIIEFNEAVKLELMKQEQNKRIVLSEITRQERTVTILNRKK